MHLDKTVAGNMDISVIIPTYNRKDVLEKCLRALSSQTLACDRFEVIVADDGSRDGTGETVTRAIPAFPARLLYSWQENAGGNAARNRAIRAASGRLVLILNDDSIAEPKLLEAHLAAHETHPAPESAILGKITISPEVPYSPFSELHLDATFAQFAGRTELDWRAFITCNISAKRSFLVGHGLFDERMRYPMHDDLEFGQRLRHHGLRVFYEPEALCHHFHLLTEADFIKQADRDGRELAKWFKREPQLRDELVTLGLYGSAPLSRELRHVLADSLVNRMTYPYVLWLARKLTPLNTPAALFTYRRVFQYLKRKAIADEMVSGGPGFGATGGSGIRGSGKRAPSP